LVEWENCFLGKNEKNKFANLIVLVVGVPFGDCEWQTGEAPRDSTGRRRFGCRGVEGANGFGSGPNVFKAAAGRLLDMAGQIKRSHGLSAQLDEHLDWYEFSVPWRSLK
jgi:hypothetical protein